MYVYKACAGSDMLSHRADQQAQHPHPPGCKGTHPAAKAKQGLGKDAKPYKGCSSGFMRSSGGVQRQGEVQQSYNGERHAGHHHRHHQRHVIAQAQAQPPASAASGV